MGDAVADDIEQSGSVAPQEVAPPPAYEDLAHRAEVFAIEASLTDEQVSGRVQLACELDVAAVTVRPSDLDTAQRAMFGNTVLGVVCGFPHGASTTGVKVFEARDAMRRGAKLVSAVLNIGKLNSRHFQYVEMEIIQLAQACHEQSAKLRVLFETPLLTEESKLVAAKICKRSEADLAMPAVAPVPPSDEEILLRKCPPLVEVTLRADDLTAALNALERGATRLLLSRPVATLAAWKERISPPKAS